MSLWISPDGFGKTWQKFDIPTKHNALVSNPSDQFCSEFLNANVSLGWAQSSAYTQIVPLGADKGLVSDSAHSAASDAAGVRLFRDQTLRVSKFSPPSNSLYGYLALLKDHIAQ